MATDNESLETTRPSFRLGWLKGIGWCVLMLAGIVAILLVWNRGKSASKLRELLTEMDRTDPGWRLEDIEAARAEVAEEDNSARVLVAAAPFLPQPWPPEGLGEDKLVPSSPAERLSREHFDRLTRELAQARPALVMLDKLADMPRGRHRLVLERNPIATRLRDQSDSRRLLVLLEYEALRQNENGETRNALRTCRAIVNTARSLGDEPLLISQLIRSTCVVHACRAIERTLAQGEPPVEDLLALQKLLENEDSLDLFRIALRGERGSVHRIFEGVEQGELSVEELEQGHSNWLESTALSLYRMDTRQDHALALSFINRRIREAELPLPEQAAAEKQFEREIRELPRSAVITRLLLPAFPKVGEAFRRKHAYLRSTIVALAAERYRQEKKAWPDSLTPLVGPYLAAMPLDPFQGTSLRYRRDGEGVVIYSVGSDGADDGGNLDREHGNRPGADIGCQLLDVARRRQAPQPK